LQLLKRHWCLVFDQEIFAQLQSLAF
jgi:hypothetical protein